MSGVIILLSWYGHDQLDTTGCSKEFSSLREGKATWTGPESSSNLRLPDFKIFGTRRW